MRSQPQTLANGIVLALFTALLSGSATIGTTLITQDREDRRQDREHSFTMTQAAQSTLAANIIAPPPSAATATPTLPPTVTPRPTQSGETLSPESALTSYYGTINDGNSAVAWQSLSSDYQASFGGLGYQGFGDFWKDAGTVNLVSVSELPGASPRGTDLLVGLYWDADPTIRYNVYHMVFDKQATRWEVDSVSPYP